MDSRDCPYITHRSQTESVTFLGNQAENTRNLYAIPGLDYVAHEDILPYSTDDKVPIQHELFDKFLQRKGSQEKEPQQNNGSDEDRHQVRQDLPQPSYSARQTLRSWQEKNYPWLELSDVHKETTESVRVTVIPFYMGYRENQNVNVYWVIWGQKLTPWSQQAATVYGARLLPYY